MTSEQRFEEIESLLATATPPRAGSTGWYDACDLFATAIKEGLRERFGRGFRTEVHGDEVGLIARVSGDGFGARPWSVDLALPLDGDLAEGIARVLDAVEAEVADAYVA